MEVAADAAASFYVMCTIIKNIAEPFECNAERCYNSC